MIIHIYIYIIYICIFIYIYILRQPHHVEFPVNDLSFSSTGSEMSHVDTNRPAAGTWGSGLLTRIPKPGILPTISAPSSWTTTSSWRPLCKATAWCSIRGTSSGEKSAFSKLWRSSCLRFLADFGLTKKWNSLFVVVKSTRVHVWQIDQWVKKKDLASTNPSSCWFTRLLNTSNCSSISSSRRFIAICRRRYSACAARSIWGGWFFAFSFFFGCCFGSFFASFLPFFFLSFLVSFFPAVQTPGPTISPTNTSEASMCNSAKFAHGGSIGKSNKFGRRFFIILPTTLAILEIQLIYNWCNSTKKKQQSPCKFQVSFALIPWSLRLPSVGVWRLPSPPGIRGLAGTRPEIEVGLWNHLGFGRAEIDSKISPNIRLGDRLGGLVDELWKSWNSFKHHNLHKFGGTNSHADWVCKIGTKITIQSGLHFGYTKRI